MTPLDPPVAFKEWAAVCRAMAEGVQSVLLRKGGISEEGGSFRPEHPRFWLFPTYFHEKQVEAIRPEYRHFLDFAECERPPAGSIRLTHVAEVLAVRYVESAAEAIASRDRHIYTDETITRRFHYRGPGLFFLDVKVLPVGPVILADRESYAGCKTWVRLGESMNSISWT